MPTFMDTTTKRSQADTKMSAEHLDAVHQVVCAVARSLARRVPDHIDVDDLVAEGWLGCLEAFKRFDAPTVDDVTYYATVRARGAMVDFLRSQDTASRDVRKKLRRVARTEHALTAELGRPPDGEELAAAAGMASVSNLDALRTRYATRSNARTSLMPTAPHSYDWMPLPSVNSAVGQLPERQQRLLTMLYQEERTLSEIGEALGVTESRICQLHGEALKRLRTRLDRSKQCRADAYAHGSEHHDNAA
jgi:RNA polymerase sigma factor for flagellar operon FliA